MRSVSFSEGGSRDRDIKFQLSRMYLVFCFLGCVVKFPQFPARELEKLTAGGEARTRILAIEFVCFFLFLSFFFFFNYFLLMIKLNEHAHTNKRVPMGLTA